MSVSRAVRPWVPTIVFIGVVLLVILAINYHTGLPYRVIGDEEGSAAFVRWIKGRTKPEANPDANWKDALSWSVEPKRFLPNFFTYVDIMEPNDQLAYQMSNIVFIHVPRTGGTTMNSCLNQITQSTNYFEDAMRFVDSSNLHRAHEELRGLGRDRKAIVSGEFAFGACDFMEGRTCSYALLMRDPYDRVISSYAFCKEHDDDESDFYCSVRTRGLSIVDWAVLEGSPLFRQLVAHPSSCGEDFESRFDFADMIRVEEGTLKKPGVYPCWMKIKAFLEHQLTAEQRDKMAEYVANNIEYWFAVVGTLDEREHFLDAMQDLYYISVYNICRDVHKAKHEGFTDEQKVEFRKELEASPLVREALKADLLLYERVKEASDLQTENLWNYYHSKG